MSDDLYSVNPNLIYMRISGYGGVEWKYMFYYINIYMWKLEQILDLLIIIIMKFSRGSGINLGNSLAGIQIALGCVLSFYSFVHICG